MQNKNPAGQGGAGSVVCNSKNTHFRHRKQILSFADINACALPLLPLLLLRWLPGGVIRSAEYVVRNPKRADNRAGSFKINTRTGCWMDFACGDRGGDVVSLAAYLFGISQGEALRRVAQMLGVTHE